MSSMSVKKIVVASLKKHKFKFSILVLLVIFGASLQLMHIYCLKVLVDAISNKVDYETVLNYVIILGAIGVSTNLFWRASGILGAYNITRSVEKTKFFFFQTILSKPHKFFEERKSGEITTKIYNSGRDIDNILCHLTWTFLPLIVSLSFSVSLFLLTSPTIGILTIVGMSIYLLSAYFGSKKVAKLSEIFSEKKGKVTGEVADITANISTVKSYTASEYEKVRFYNHLKEETKAHYDLWGTQEKIKIFQNTLFLAFTFCNILIVSYLWSIGVCTTGDIILVVQINMIISNEIRMASDALVDFQENIGSIDSCIKYICNGSENNNPESRQVETTKLVPSIEFRGINFVFPNGNPMFTNLSFNINPGEKVGIVGRSGGGKSTIFKLLSRHYEISSGQILIGDVNIQNLDLNILRGMISTVSQESELFCRTINENIGYGKKFSLESIIEASKKAHAHDFISKLLAGYESIVGERGVTLSGGQKQRISIARAILKDAPILLLDEATSALDSESEELIQEALEEVMDHKTCVIIAHRLSTIKKMDRILVLDQGQIAEQGSHEQLIKTNGIYKKLWDRQTKSI